MKADRRRLLKALALAPVAAATGRASATDYASAADVFAAIDRLEADVASRLAAIEARVPQAHAFAAAVAADHARHRAVRAGLRRRLGLTPPAPVEPRRGSTDLPALRQAQQDLVHAHAEGLPALGDTLAVDGLARDMVDLSRHLAVIDLWLESEAPDA